MSEMKKALLTIAILVMLVGCTETRDEAIQRQIENLKSNDPTIRSSAAFALGNYLKDEKAVKSLIESTKDEDPDVRRRSIYALHKIGDKRAIAAFVGALKDKNEEVRFQATYALSNFAYRKMIDNAAVEPLIEALKDKEFHGLVAANAASALGFIKDKRAIEPLIATLKHESYDARKAAADALGLLLDKMAVEPLIEAIKDEDVQVCLSAASALKKITGENFGTYYPGWKAWYEKKQEKNILERVNELQKTADLANRGRLGCGMGTFELQIGDKIKKVEAGLDPIHVFGKRINIEDLQTILASRVDSYTNPGSPMSGDFDSLCYVCLSILKHALEPGTVPLLKSLLQDPSGAISGWAAIVLLHMVEKDNNIKRQVHAIAFPSDAIKAARSRGAKIPDWVKTK